MSDIAQDIKERIESGMTKLAETGDFVIDHDTFVELKEKKRCMMCGHKKDEPHILPGDGKFNPSPSWMFHYQDTHGQPADIMASNILFSVYKEKDTGNSALSVIWGDMYE